MMHLSGDNDIPDTYAGRLIGVFFIVVIMRLPRETSLCKIIFIVRVAWKRAIFDSAHWFVQVGASSTCRACIFIMGVFLAFFKRFMHRPVCLAHKAVGEDCAILTR